MNKKIILNELQNANDKILLWIYNRYRENFINKGIKKYPIDRKEMLEIYRNTILDLYENVLNKKLTIQDSDIKSYIFHDGNKKIRLYLRTKHFEIGKSENNIDDVSENTPFIVPSNSNSITTNTELDNLEKEKKRKHLRQMFDEADKNISNKKKKFNKLIVTIIIFFVVIAGSSLIIFQLHKSGNNFENQRPGINMYSKDTGSHNKLHLFKLFGKKNKKDNKKKIHIQELYDKYFQIYPFHFPVNTTIDPHDSLMVALNLYSERRFDAALVILSKLIIEKKRQDSLTDITFFTSMCYMNSGRLKKVFKLLSTLSLTENKYHNEALWYLSLANLKKNRINESKAILENIITNKNYNYQKAQLLLNDLDKQ